MILQQTVNFNSFWRPAATIVFNQRGPIITQLFADPSTSQLALIKAAVSD
jgi:hypothetical protein